MGTSRIILHIVSDLNIGGVQHVVMNYLRLSHLFYPNNLVVLVLSRNNHSVYDEEVAEHSFPVEYMDFRPVHIFRIIDPIANWISLQWKLYRTISHYNPSVIHSHGTRLLPYLVPTFFLRRSSVFVHTLHSVPTMLPPINRLIAKLVFHIFPIIPICVTDTQAKCAEQKYRLENIKVIHNPVDTYYWGEVNRIGLRKQMGIAEDCFVIGYVGRLDKVKNIPFLIDLFGEFYKINSNSILVLVGEGSEKNTIEKYIFRAGLSENVVLVGFQKDVSLYYALMDLFMLTSSSESCSIATLEAQVAGVRCVVSDCVPQDSVISDLVCRVPLNANKGLWMDAILGKYAPDVPKEDISSYNAVSIIRELTEVYESNLLS